MDCAFDLVTLNSLGSFARLEICALELWFSGAHGISRGETRQGGI